MNLEALLNDIIQTEIDKYCIAHVHKVIKSPIPVMKNRVWLLEAGSVDKKRQMVSSTHFQIKKLQESNILLGDNY